jgi:hypothetical protein
LGRLTMARCRVEGLRHLLHLVVRPSRILQLQRPLFSNESNSSSDWRS